jgi:hypothetical protein
MRKGQKEFSFNKTLFLLSFFTFSFFIYIFNFHLILFQIFISKPLTLILIPNWFVSFLVLSRKKIGNIEIRKETKEKTLFYSIFITFLIFYSLFFSSKVPIILAQTPYCLDVYATDTDGDNIYTKGTCTIKCKDAKTGQWIDLRSFTDYCASSDSVVEYVAEYAAGTAGCPSYSTACPSGYVCKDGACVPDICKDVSLLASVPHTPLKVGEKAVLGATADCGHTPILKIYEGNTVLKTCISYSCSVDVSKSSPGTYTYEAIAYYLDGRSWRSNEVTLQWVECLVDSDCPACSSGVQPVCKNNECKCEENCGGQYPPCDSNHCCTYDIGERPGTCKSPGYISGKWICA